MQLTIGQIELLTFISNVDLRCNHCFQINFKAKSQERAPKHGFIEIIHVLSKALEPHQREAAVPNNFDEANIDEENFPNDEDSAHVLNNRC